MAPETIATSVFFEKPLGSGEASLPRKGRSDHRQTDSE
jgi:hypothetical protein